MKKVISIVMVTAVLLATFVSCGSAITGKWTAVYLETNDMKVKMGPDYLDMHLEIKSDGTAIGTTGTSDESKMKWKEDKGVYTFTGESGRKISTGKLENGVLVLNYVTAKIYMSKNPKSFNYPSDVVDHNEMPR